jgi:tetratricopeptide (TPR) repeat protein
MNLTAPGTVDIVRSVGSVLVLAGVGGAMVAALLRWTSTLPETLTPTVPLEPRPGDQRRLVSPSSRKHQPQPHWSRMGMLIRVVLHLAIWIAIPLLLYHGAVRPFCGGRLAALAELNLPGNPEGALRWFEQAAALAPEEQKYWVRQGMVAITAARSPGISLEERRNLLLRARSASERAIEMIDPDPVAHAQHAHALLELTGVGLATPAATLAAFDRAIALDPANPLLLAQAGGAALKLHDLARLQYCLASGLDSYPKCRQLRMLAAFADFHRDRFADAECRLFELFPPHVDLRDYPDEDSEIHGMAVLAACHVKSHQLDRAIRLAKFAVDLRPANLLARWTLAHALERTGKHREAADQLEKLLELQPGNPAVRQALDRVRSQESGDRSQESE